MSENNHNVVGGNLFNRLWKVTMMICAILFIGELAYLSYSMVSDARREEEKRTARLAAVENRLEQIEKLVKSPVVVQLVAADGTRRYAVGGNAATPAAPKIQKKNPCGCGHCPAVRPVTKPVVRQGGER